MRFEDIAFLVLPYLEDDRSWIGLVTSVNKKITKELDLDIHWEDHFNFSIQGLLSRNARFCLSRYVKCKRIVFPVYDRTISERYHINLTVVPGKCKARQMVRQFLLAEKRIEEHFSGDEGPSVAFCEDDWSHEELEKIRIECGGYYEVGFISIRLVTGATLPDDDKIVHGDLQQLRNELTEELDVDMCSDCERSEYGSESYDVSVDDSDSDQFWM